MAFKNITDTRFAANKKTPKEQLYWSCESFIISPLRNDAKRGQNAIGDWFKRVKTQNRSGKISAPTAAKRTKLCNW